VMEKREHETNKLRSLANETRVVLGTWRLTQDVPPN
jgi:hypothetical protein